MVCLHIFPGLILREMLDGCDAGKMMRRDIRRYGRLVVISGDRGSVGCSSLAESCRHLWCGVLKLEGTNYLYLSKLLLVVRSESFSQRESYK